MSTAGGRKRSRTTSGACRITCCRASPTIVCRRSRSPAVDDYRSFKVREGVLSASSINKTLALLGTILDVADERGLIDRNPLRVNPRKRRRRVSKPTPVWLDRAEHVGALLDAAGELDQAVGVYRWHVPKRAILATLVFAGLRIGELLDLRWRDVDIAGGRITVRASKTDAGVRQIDMLPALRDEVLALKANARRTDAGDLVFGTSRANQQNASNIRTRVLAPAVDLANQRLEEAGEVPLPERLTPHKLRHTFASLLVALGVDPGATMDQVGHANANFTLRVYRHGMRRDPASKAALRKLVGRNSQPDWAEATGDIGQPTGSNGSESISTTPQIIPSSAENPVLSRPFEWSQPGSNRRPPACKAGALPTELWPRRAWSLMAPRGGPAEQQAEVAVGDLVRA